MDLTTIDIPPAEAAAKLGAYAAQLASERTAEDQAILAGYRAAARGLQVISLRATIAAGGFHENGLPRIAVINADARTCFCSWDSSDLVFATTGDWHVNQGALVGARSVRVPVAAPPQDRSTRYWRRAQAPVPITPPEHRPRLARLRRRHVLWEVEAWEPVPARDPALLQHIRGDLWAVLATWDLTELERAVLAQR